MLTIRPARSADIGTLVRVALASWELAITAWGEDVEKLRANAEIAYAEFCTRSWPDIIVAEWDGVIAGWGANENADNQITDLWVGPQFQRNGIGTRLLDLLEEAVRARGYPNARLDTHARNIDAIRLFKRRGYHVSAYTVAYSAPLDEDIDKVEMVKDFEPAAEEIPEALADDGLYGG